MTTWHFAPNLRARMAAALRSMIPERLHSTRRSRRNVDADRFLDDLEDRLLWIATPVGLEPRPRDFDLPPKMRHAAYLLLVELRNWYARDPDMVTVLWGPRESGVERFVGWVRPLERIAEAPRPPRSGRPRTDESDRARVEDRVVRCLKRAGLTWRDGPHAACVLAAAIEGMFGSQGAYSSPEAARAALRRVVRRRDELAERKRKARAARRAAVLRPKAE